jgi:hypothetical protein
VQDGLGRRLRPVDRPVGGGSAPRRPADAFRLTAAFRQLCGSAPSRIEGRSVLAPVRGALVA